MIALLFAAYFFSVLANVADEYTTQRGLRSRKVWEVNSVSPLVRMAAVHPIWSAWLKCVALPILGLADGWLVYAPMGIFYNGIFGAVVAFVAIRNYRIDRQVGA